MAHQLTTDLHMHINRARDQHDPDVAVEQLEAAIKRIDDAVGFEHKAVPAPDDSATGDELLNRARTAIRNGDLTTARILLLQVLALEDGPPVNEAPDAKGGKPLDAMTKAELHAYAKERGYEVSAASPKAGLLEHIKELDEQAAAAATG